MKSRTNPALYTGLFLTTLSTLIIEILNARLLSVLTWYHLSFLAVSLAMLGMSAGAVRVFLQTRWNERVDAASALSRFSYLFAISIVLSHLITLFIPIPVLRKFSAIEVIGIAISTSIIAVPFFLSGIVVTLALTRPQASIGSLYCSDLFGAALGCLAVIVILNTSNITSAFLLAAAAASIGSFFFERFASASKSKSRVLMSIFFAGLATINGMAGDLIGIPYPKNKDLWLQSDSLEQRSWNTHSYVTIQKPSPGRAFYWGGGKGSEAFHNTASWVIIDGEAGTPITLWDGKVGSLDWVQYDVTTMPYHLRHGEAAIIGVGGGRDLLAAIWGRSTSIVGIEINRILIDTLTGSHRTFARIADQPNVRLIHDEARSYFSRVRQRFDVLQMSLIDTWAATGAGAFTLTENGLYTIEAWHIFLNALKSHGVFSVSRWFRPSELSETNRLVALGVAALLDRGVVEPSKHLVLISRGPIATLLISVDPFSPSDLQKIEETANRFEFSVLLEPGKPSPSVRLSNITNSKSSLELMRATDHQDFDFRPPTDMRPFFFNMLKPSSFYRFGNLPRGGILWGNLRATSTLVLLFFIALGLVIAIILYPLARAGIPPSYRSYFVDSVLYFAMIGTGFMLIQIAFLQRFSVFLGHPTYALSVVLFVMILCAGLGSYLSDRIPIENGKWTILLPLSIGTLVFLEAALIKPCTQSTVQFGLLVRVLVVTAFTAPISTLLGFCFPLGFRVLSGLSNTATSWMWGVNGASSVLATIVAVGISMWMGIHMNLIFGGLLYLALCIPARRLTEARSKSAIMQPAHDFLTKRSASD